MNVRSSLSYSREAFFLPNRLAAGVKVAKANLEQGEAEYRDAERQLQRTRDLVAKKFVSEASLDAAQRVSTRRLQR